MLTSKINVPTSLSKVIFQLPPLRGGLGRGLLSLLLILFGTLRAYADSEVIIKPTPKHDPLPPSVAVYYENPGRFFNMTITNPLDEELDVYLTLKLESIDGALDVPVEMRTDKDPTNISPESVLHLLPSTTRMLTLQQITDAFKFYTMDDFTGLNEAMAKTSIFGLIPEGAYKLTVNAFKADGMQGGTKHCLSNPELSWCIINICYMFTPPQILGDIAHNRIVPDMPSADDPYFRPEFAYVPHVDFCKQNIFNWSAIASACSNFTPSQVKYRLDIHALLDFSLDEVDKYPGTKLREFPTMTLSAMMAESVDQTIWVKGRYYALRVQATIVGPNASNDVGYRLIDNDGYGEWVVVRYEPDAPPLVEEVLYDPSVPDPDPEPQADCCIKLLQPKLTSPDPGDDGFQRRLLPLEDTKNIECAWDRPTVVSFDEKKYKQEDIDKLEFVYTLGVYRVPDDIAGTDAVYSSIDEICKTTPLYIKKDITGLSHQIPYSEIVDSIELYKSYMIVVRAALKKDKDCVCWSTANNNCYTFGFFAGEAQVFKPCNQDDPDFSDKKGILLQLSEESELVLTVGSSIAEHAFPLHITELKKQSSTTDSIPTYNGKGYIIWSPFGSKMKISVTFTGLAANSKHQVIAGSVVSAEHTDWDWVPYEAIDMGLTRAKGYLESQEWYNNTVSAIETFGDDLMAGIDYVGKSIDEVKDAVMGKIGDAVSAAGSTVGINTDKMYDKYVTSYVEKYTASGAIADAKSAAKSAMDGYIHEYLSPEGIKDKCGKYWERIDAVGHEAGNMFSVIDAFVPGVNMGSAPIVLPLRVPCDFWNSTSVGPDPNGTGTHYDISIMRMEFGPRLAQMSVLVLANLPGGEPEESGEGISYSKVLAFVANRLCFTPSELLPYSGEAGLLYDFNIKNNATKFDFTFKAPTVWTGDDMDGCAVHWDSGAKEVLISAQGDMSVPGIWKETSEEMPRFGFHGKVFIGGKNSGDWSVGLSMEPFRVPSIPDFIFTAGDSVILDMSVRNNMPGLTIPDHYDWTQWVGTKSLPGGKTPTLWQGLYIKKIGVKFPKALEFGDSEGKGERFELAIENVIYDKTGFSMSAAANHVLDASTGRLGGWSFTMDKVSLDILQNDFKGSTFSGTIGVPILEGDIGYKCEMALLPDFSDDEMSASQYANENLWRATNSDGKAETSDGSPLVKGNKRFHLIFKTDIVDSMTVDMKFATAHVSKKGTWFKVDYLEGYDTDIELMLSGTLTIGSKDDANADGTGSKVGKIPFEVPGVRFTGMRIANFSVAQKKNVNGKTKTYAELFAENYVPTFEKQGYKGWNPFGSMSKDEYTKRVIDDLQGSADNKSHEVSVGDSFYFNYGSWSLASTEKTFFGIPFTLKKFDFGTEGENMQISINGGLGLVPIGKKDANGNAETAIGGTAGVKIIFKLDTSAGIKNVSKWKLEYVDTKIDTIMVNGSFGGGKVTIDGWLAVDTGDALSRNKNVGIDMSGKKGFSGGLSMNVADLFKLDVAGGFYEVVENDDKYKALFFAAMLGTKNGIELGGGIKLTDIGGGFYFNYAMKDVTEPKFDAIKAALMKPEIKKNAIGGAFCLGLAWGDGDAGFKGQMGMIVNYDKERDRLGQFMLSGHIGGMKDLISADCVIKYENNTRAYKTVKHEDGTETKELGEIPNEYSKQDELKYNDCQYFRLSITVDATADMTEAAVKFIGEENIEAFNNATKALAAAANGDLNQFGQEGSETQPGETKTEQHSTKKGSDGLSANCGATLSMEFEFRNYPNSPGKKKKWHFYLGEPDYDKRCKIVWFDLQIGKSPAMIRAYAFADAYLCLGNELPNNGVLPPLPEPIEEFLGKGSTDPSVSAPAGASDAYKAAMNETIAKGPGGENAPINGGIQFGVRIGADFECEAVFAYARMGGQLGFDAVLKQYGENCRCSDGSRMGGKGGLYAMAQVYAYLYGSLGLMIDIGIFKGKFDLATLEMGAMLKGGFPNPAWAYGKVRARGSILDGLFKFDKKVELKVGRVCVPIQGDPLSSIEIFSDFNVGDTIVENGWKEDNAVDIASVPAFVTTMAMGTEMLLLDEDRKNAMLRMDASIEEEKAVAAKCMRRYRFTLDPTVFYKHVGEEEENYTYTYPNVMTKDNYTWEVRTGALDPHTCYSLYLSGKGEEYFTDEGKWGRPLIRDKETGEETPQDFVQHQLIYFRTAGLPEDWTKNVGTLTPFDETDAIIDEVAAPSVSMLNDYTPMFDNHDLSWYADLQEVQTDKAGNVYYTYPDVASYDQTTQSAFSMIPLHYNVEEGTYANGSPYKFFVIEPAAMSDANRALLKPNTKYRWSFYSLDTKGLDEYMGSVKATYQALQTDLREGMELAMGLAGTLKFEGDEQTELTQSLMSLGSTDTDFAELAGDEGFQKLVRQIDDKVKQAGSKFRQDRLRFEVTTGTYRTLKDKVNAAATSKTVKFSTRRTLVSPADRQARKLTYNDDEDLGALQVHPVGIDYKTAEQTEDNNAYYNINWWGAHVMRALSAEPENAGGSSNTTEMAYRHMHNHRLTESDALASGKTLDITKLDVGINVTGNRTLWRNKLIEGESSVYSFETTDHYGQPHTDFEALFSPMRSNQWIPVLQAEGNTLGCDITFTPVQLLKMDAMMASSLSASMRNGWRDAALPNINKKYSNFNWEFDERVPGNNTHYYQDLKDLYKAFVKGEATLTNASSYSNFSNYAFSAPMHQSLLIQFMAHRHLVYNRYSASTEHSGRWPADLDKTTRRELQGMASDDVMKAADILYGTRFAFGAEAALANIKALKFRVRRPNGINRAATNGGQGTLTERQLIDGMSKYEQDVTVRPSTMGNEVELSVGVNLNASTTQSNYQNSVTVDVVDEVPITDEAFRAYLLYNFDKSGDGELQTEELEAIETISTQQRVPDAVINKYKLNLSGNWYIRSLEGVQNMPNLKRLAITNVADNRPITGLNFSRNRALRSLDVGNPSQEIVDLSGLANLETVYLSGPVRDTELTTTEYANGKFKAGIGTLKLNGCSSLGVLEVANNHLTELNVKDCAGLWMVDVNCNLIKHLDARGLTDLAQVRFGRQMKAEGGKMRVGATIDVELSSTEAYNYIKETGNGIYAENYNVNVTEMEIYDADNISLYVDELDQQLLLAVMQRSIELRKKGKTTDRDCFTLYAEPSFDIAPEAKLDPYTLQTAYGMDWERFMNLRTIKADGRGVKSLDKLAKFFPKLEELSVSDNSLTVVNTVGLKELRTLRANNCGATDLAIDPNSIYFRHLECENNRLMSLNTQSMSGLRELYCAHNFLQSLDLTGCKELSSLDCSYNMIQSLNLAAQSAAMDELNISYNPINSGSGFMNLAVTFTPSDKLQQLNASGLSNLSGNVDLSKLAVKELYLEDNPQMQKVQVNMEKIATLVTQNSPKSYLPQFIVASATSVKASAPMLFTLKVRNTSFGNTQAARGEYQTLYMPEDTHLEEFDITNTNVDQIMVSDKFNTQQGVDKITMFKIGAPDRMKGYNVSLRANVATQPTMFKRWFSEWMNDPDNRNAVFTMSTANVDRSDFKLEEITDDDQKLKALLGDKLHDQLWKMYEPDHRCFHAATAKTITDLDVVGYSPLDLQGILKYFPSLKRLKADKCFVQGAESNNLNLNGTSIGTIDLRGARIGELTPPSFTGMGDSICLANARYTMKDVVYGGSIVNAANGNTTTMLPATYMATKFSNVDLSAGEGVTAIRINADTKAKSLTMDDMPKLEEVYVESWPSQLTTLNISPDATGTVNIYFDKSADIKKWYDTNGALTGIKTYILTETSTRKQGTSAAGRNKSYTYTLVSSYEQVAKEVAKSKASGTTYTFEMSGTPATLSGLTETRMPDFTLGSTSTGSTSTGSTSTGNTSSGNTINVTDVKAGFGTMQRTSKAIKK